MVDHGAPFFEGSDPRFLEIVRSWVDSDACAEWRPSRGTWNDGSLRSKSDATPVFVGTPSMGALMAHLSSGLEVRTDSAVTSIQPHKGGWMLRLGEREEAGPFARVVLTGPPEQIGRLINDHPVRFGDRLGALASRPVWVLMAIVADELKGLPDILDVESDMAIEKAVRDDAKPQRQRTEGRSRWVLHACSEWSLPRYEAPREGVEKELCTELTRVLDTRKRLLSARAHRWGLARPARVMAGERCLIDVEAGLIACGDGMGGEGVEGAWLSGVAAAGAVAGAP